MPKARSCDAPDAILGQLDRLIASPNLGASERNRKFLRYVVEETLAGRSDHIKAYNIATSAFGRGPDFDPQQDAIVRIEAGRLRRALEHYYLTAGADDPLRITIPLGSYVPEFFWTEPAGHPDQTDGQAEPAQGRPARMHRPTLLVRAFEAEGDQSGHPGLTRGFTRHLVVGLSRFSGLTVLGPDTAQPGSSGDGTAANGHCEPVDFVLSGGTTITAAGFGAEIVLVEAATGRCIWAQTYNRPFAGQDASVVRDEIALTVAGTLAQPYGIIFAHLLAAMESGEAVLDDARSTLLRFGKYWRGYNGAELSSLTRDLEQLVRQHPTDCELLATLSMACSNTVRFGPHATIDARPALARAEELARRAILYQPQSGRGFLALSVACWFLGDVAESLGALHRAIALNPVDSEAMAELGMRLAILADWDKAVPLLQQAFERNPALPGSFRVGLALWHYAHGRYAEAHAEALRIDTPQIVYGLVVEAAAAGRLGLARQGTAAVEAILRLHPDYPEEIAADLQFRNVEEALATALIDGLELAGFPRPGAGARTRGTGGHPRRR